MSSSKRLLYAALVVAMALSMVLPFVSTGASPANGITAPKDGATASGVVNVLGFADDPNFLKWQLDVLPGGNADQAIFVALGAKPGEFAYDLDTTRFPDGEHALRLRVVRSDSNYDEYLTKLTIANAAAATHAAASTAALAANPPSAAPDIIDTAIASGEFGTLVAAVQAAGLADALKGPGPYTVFAPDQKAFAAIPAATLTALLKDPKALSNILLYHVVPGKVMAADVKDGLSAKTLQGGNVTFKVADGKVTINDANIVSTDIAASNGVIHVIDKVILPPTAAPAAKTASAASDIVNTAVSSGQFGTLVAAVQAAGLVDALKGPGPYTVFAPDQKAFAAIPAATLTALLKDPKALSNILLYHVVPGKVMAADVKDGLTAKTLQGGNVTFKVADGKVTINDANIVSTDIAASNGVIHVIDKVILPTAVANPNGINSPKEGAVVSGAAEAKGFAQDPNFLKWQLDLLPGGDAYQAISLAVGDKPGDFTYSLDTTSFPNGEHALRLRVVRTDSNYDEYFTKLTVKN